MANLLAFVFVSLLAVGVGAGEEYDHETALTLTEHVSATYCMDFPRLRAWNCSRCSDRTAGFQVTEVYHDAKAELMVYTGVSPRLNAFLVVFRGTKKSSVKNWISNLRFNRAQLPYADVKRAYVHAGFLRLYEGSHARKRVLDAVARRPRDPATGEPLRVRIVGHSLGGALATLCALELAATQAVHPSTMLLFTIGSPRVGNAIFVDYFWRHLAGRSWRVTNGHDIVPALPPRRFGYRHIPTEVFHFRYGRDRAYRGWTPCVDTKDVKDMWPTAERASESGASLGRMLASDDWAYDAGDDPEALAAEAATWVDDVATGDGDDGVRDVAVSLREDPLCQGSLCKLGPRSSHCASITDHLHYLALNTYQGDGSPDC